MRRPILLAIRLAGGLPGLANDWLRISNDLRALVVRVFGEPSARMEVTGAEQRSCDSHGEESFHIAWHVGVEERGLGRTTMQ